VAYRGNDRATIWLPRNGGSADFGAHQQDGRAGNVAANPAGTIALLMASRPTLNSCEAGAVWRSLCKMLASSSPKRLEAERWT
jgi:hypothetical protein